MKIKSFFPFSMPLLVAFTSMSCSTSQPQYAQGPEDFILRFYKVYHGIWDSEDPLTKRQRLDSVLQLYLTLELFSKVKEPDLDHDSVIKDHYTTSEYLHTLSVARIENSENCFVVTYKAPSESPLGEFELVDIAISICLVKDKDDYKLSSIE